MRGNPVSDAIISLIIIINWIIYYSISKWKKKKKKKKKKSKLIRSRLAAQ